MLLLADDLIGKELEETNHVDALIQKQQATQTQPYPPFGGWSSSFGDVRSTSSLLLACDWVEGLLYEAGLSCEKGGTMSSCAF